MAETKGRREDPTRFKVYGECDRLKGHQGPGAGDPSRVKLKDLRKRFVDRGDTLKRYLDEWRQLPENRAASSAATRTTDPAGTEVTPDLQASIMRMVKQGIADGVAEALGNADGPAPRRRGRPTAEETAAKIAAKISRARAPSGRDGSARNIGKHVADAEGADVKPFKPRDTSPPKKAAPLRDRGFMRLVADKEKARRGKAVAHERPAAASGYLDAESIAALDAVGLFRAALDGRLPPPPIVPVRKRDWKGAWDPRYARALAGFLRKTGREATDDEVMALLREKFAFTGSAPHAVLKGASIVKKGATWWFDGEKRPGRRPVKRDDPRKTLYLAAALQMLTEREEWTWPADLEDALLEGRRLFRKGWLADALRRASRRSGSGVTRSGDGRYRASQPRPSESRRSTSPPPRTAPRLRATRT